MIDENTGRNVAVAYDEKDAALLAAAPDMAEALKAIIAVLDQPVQHTGLRTPASTDILRMDAATAKNMARSALEKAGVS